MKVITCPPADLEAALWMQLRAGWSLVAITATAWQTAPARDDGRGGMWPGSVRATELTVVLLNAFAEHANTDGEDTP